MPEIKIPNTKPANKMADLHSNGKTVRTPAANATA